MKKYLCTEFIKKIIRIAQKVLYLWTKEPTGFLNSKLDKIDQDNFSKEVSIFYSITLAILLGIMVSEDIKSCFVISLMGLVIASVPMGYLYLGARWWLIRCSPKTFGRVFLDVVMSIVLAISGAVFYILTMSIVNMSFYILTKNYVTRSSYYMLQQSLFIFYTYIAICFFFIVVWFKITERTDERFKRGVEHKEENTELLKTIKVNYKKYGAISISSLFFALVNENVSHSLLFFTVYVFVFVVLWYGIWKYSLAQTD